MQEEYDRCTDELMNELDADFARILEMTYRGDVIKTLINLSK